LRRQPRRDRFGLGRLRAPLGGAAADQSVSDQQSPATCWSASEPSFLMMIMGRCPDPVWLISPVEGHDLPDCIDFPAINP
jgi:hypothetical protein